MIGDRGAAVHAPRHGDEDGLVNLQEIAEIELFILKRMKEFTLGDHASVFKGAGLNFVGLRDWEPGDRMSSIDWSHRKRSTSTARCPRGSFLSAVCTTSCTSNGAAW